MSVRAAVHGAHDPRNAHALTARVYVRMQIHMFTDFIDCLGKDGNVTSKFWSCEKLLSHHRAPTVLRSHKQGGCTGTCVFDAPAGSEISRGARLPVQPT